MSVERRKNQPMQMALAFVEERRSEARKASMEGTETLAAEHRIESPADKGLTRRTAGCGPACPVVWEGRGCEASPYPDLDA